MNIYKFYTFKNNPREDRAQLFDFDADDKLQQADPVQLFGNIFNSRQIELTVPKDIHGKEWDTFRCQVLRHEEGVILMTLENNRSKHTIVNLKEVEHEHHPFCRVIIDNRHGQQMIGIERNSAFGTNTDKVADLLQKGLTYKMYDYRRKIEIERLAKQTTNLWDVADEIADSFNDHITQICIDYVGENNTRASSANNILASVFMLADKSDSKALLTLSAKNDDGVQVDNIRDDMQHIADQCLRHRDYELVVKFKNFGVYRYGADLAAQFNMDESVTDNFANGSKAIGFDTQGPSYELVLWLNRLNTLTNKNYKNEPLQPKRTRRSRR